MSRFDQLRMAYGCARIRVICRARGAQTTRAVMSDPSGERISIGRRIAGDTECGAGVQAAQDRVAVQLNGRVQQRDVP
jgi:hypothetical protein